MLEAELALLRLNVQGLRDDVLVEALVCGRREGSRRQAIQSVSGIFAEISIERFENNTASGN